MSILVIGETCLDVFCYGKCDRLAPEAPAPVFNPIETITNPGMAKNVQTNIQALGMGCDLFTNANWGEITKTRFIHKNTNQMFLRVDENESKIKRCAVESIPLKEYDVVVVSDYCKGFLTDDDIQYITKNHECAFVDTKKRLGEWCRDASYIKINNIEFNKTKDSITEDFRGKLIVTLGSKGCTFQDKVYPVKSVEIKDVSGQVTLSCQDLL